MSEIKLPNIDFLVKEAIDKSYKLLEDNRFKEAEVILKQLLRVDQKNIQGLQLLGSIKYKNKEYGEAIKLFITALKNNPQGSESHNNLSLCYAAMGFIDKAIEHAEKAVNLKPDNSEYYGNLGMHYRQKTDYPKALECFKKSLEIKESFYIWGHLGSLYGILKDLPKAEECLKKSIELNPKYHLSYVDLAHAYLLQGRYEEAWPYYEHRLQCFPPALGFKTIYNDCNKWDGKKSLENKRIVIYCEQGKGDFIQFIRYAPLLKSRGSTVFVHAPKEFSCLLKNMNLEVKDVYLPEEYDYHCSMVSLPYLLNSPEVNIPYIRCDKKMNLSQYPQFKIGIAWAGNPQHPADRSRSCKLKYFKDIHDIHDVKLFSLQKDTRCRQYNNTQPIDLTDGCNEMKVVDLSEWINDFEDLSAFINEMDLIISVDTSVVHLAGALGKKTWVILPYNPDWRWGLEKNTTSWYPSIRLFRQNNPSSWDSVFTDVYENLISTLQQKPQ